MPSGTSSVSRSSSRMETVFSSMAGSLRPARAPAHRGNPQTSPPRFRRPRPRAHELAPRADPELAVRVAQVDLDRLGRHEELLRDVAVGLARPRARPRGARSASATRRRRAPGGAGGHPPRAARCAHARPAAPPRRGSRARAPGAAARARRWACRARRMAVPRRPAPWPARGARRVPSSTAPPPRGRPSPSSAAHGAEHAQRPPHRGRGAPGARAPRARRPRRPAPRRRVRAGAAPPRGRAPRQPGRVEDDRAEAVAREVGQRQRLLRPPLGEQHPQLGRDPPAHLGRRRQLRPLGEPGQRQRRPGPGQVAALGAHLGQRRGWEQHHPAETPGDDALARTHEHLLGVGELAAAPQPPAPGRSAPRWPRTASRGGAHRRATPWCTCPPPRGRRA